MEPFCLFCLQKNTPFSFEACQLPWPGFMNTTPALQRGEQGIEKADISWMWQKQTKVTIIQPFLTDSIYHPNYPKKLHN